MIKSVTRFIALPALALATAMIPVIASACVVCSASLSCGPRGCTETVTCTYTPGQCQQPD